MAYDLDALWNELENSFYGGQGVYRRLDMEQETGVRLAILSPGRTRAILIELNLGETTRLCPPTWRGMNSKTVQMDGAVESSEHLCLSVERPENRSVFSIFCSDVVGSLERNIGSSRRENIQQCFDRWSRFFDRYSEEGLSQERQRGLFGELCLLEKLIEFGLPVLESVTSWKGCLGEDHDFMRQNRAIEVKTTITKEERKISVSSDRQLDDSNLGALFLYVLSIQQVEGSGRTLPELVDSLRSCLEWDANASFVYESGLISAGYLDYDAQYYSSSYLVRKNEAFLIGNGFPRIITLPPGVGNLEYTVAISACYPFLVTVEGMLREFNGCNDHGKH